MPLNEKYKAKKQNNSAIFLVFHCFALTTPKMLKLFNNYGTSVHYIIKHNGKIIQLVAENKIAHHAGVSIWRGENGLNDKSIGIELQNSEMGQQKYTNAQIKSLINLAQDIIKRHNIKAQNIVGHSDIAPIRKPDPAKFFPWETLAENGIGIWPKIQKQPEIKLFDDDKIRSLLKKIGYNTDDLTAAFYAFTTRFMPKKIELQNDLIEREAKVFAYWSEIKPDGAAAKSENSPKIYPPMAEKLKQDTEILARLEQIAEAYENMG